MEPIMSDELARRAEASAKRLRSAQKKLKSGTSPTQDPPPSIDKQTDPDSPNPRGPRKMKDGTDESKD